MEHSKGEWKADRNGEGFDMGEMKHIFVRCGKILICRIDGYLNRNPNVAPKHPTESEAIANGQLIADAGTVANEIGLTPRQLLKQRDDLRAACKWLLKSYKGMLKETKIKYKKGQIPGITQAEQAIADNPK